MAPRSLRARRIDAILRPSACLLVMIALAPGCDDRAADRTLSIHQFQSMDTEVGQFQIDASQLPKDAIRTRTDRGPEGAPVTSLEIDQRYNIRVVLVPVTDDE